MCLVVASETTQIKSHQHDFLNMSWAKMKIDMVKWVEKARKPMKSEQVHKEHTHTRSINEKRSHQFQIKRSAVRDGLEGGNKREKLHNYIIV